MYFTIRAAPGLSGPANMCVVRFFRKIFVPVSCVGDGLAHTVQYDIGAGRYNICWICPLQLFLPRMSVYTINYSCSVGAPRDFSPGIFRVIVKSARGMV